MNRISKTLKEKDNILSIYFTAGFPEINSTNEIFSNPQHNYTKELLRAIPKPNPIGREERKKKRL